MLAGNLCTGCTACCVVCPVSAITVQEDEFGAKYPKIDETKCVQCSLCEKTCPVLQIEQGNASPASVLNVYAIQAEDEQLRRESSSGGLFSLLAKHVLSENGVVVGCTMTEDCSAAQHVIVENEADLALLRGSKYVQSDLGDVLKKTIALVKAGRKVLFSGTPCQVAGLHYALGKKKYDNLWTVDFICHGVPVPFAWKKYLHDHECKQGAKARKVFFRDKMNGWRTYTLVVEFENGAKYTSKVTEDLYLRGFINNAYLRSSCYHCKAKGDSYFSDITIADFWGVDKHVPNFNDNRGTSLAIIHTEKAAKVLNAISAQLRKVEIDAKDALANNPSYVSSVPYNPLRKRIMREIKKQPLSKVIERYYSIKLSSKLRRRLLMLIEK